MLLVGKRSIIEEICRVDWMPKGNVHITELSLFIGDKFFNQNEILSTIDTPM